MDRLLMDTLMRGVSEDEYKTKFKEAMKDTNDAYRRNMDFFSRSTTDTPSYRKHSESAAHNIVYNMYHLENGKSISGEKFDMEKAKKVKEKYSDVLSDISIEDIYIAINAQYHDYAPLFKTWFREGIEYKIIESAIVFWFCDVDYNGESKIDDYFNK